jgi:hypothetical protein
MYFKILFRKKQTQIKTLRVNLLSKKLKFIGKGSKKQLRLLCQTLFYNTFRGCRVILGKDGCNPLKKFSLNKIKFVLNSLMVHVT